MKKNNASQYPRWMPPVLGGALCAALTGAATWYDLAYNGGRLVYPMDSYVFQSTDIPMIAALALDFLYALYLLVLLVRGAVAQKKQVRETRRTRRLSPKFGLLGFLGFLGFAGFGSYSAWGDASPFVFFAFFGFFGFFFEGKMSGTLMDERFRENAVRAELKAYRTGFIAVFLLLIASGQSGRFSAEVVAPFMIGGVAMAVALTMFLSEYLLYRYDHDDALELEAGDE